MFRLPRLLGSLLAAISLLLCTSALAQDEFARNIAPELSFTENYADEVRSLTEYGWTDYWTRPDASSKFKLNAKVSAAGMNVAAFNASTPFYFLVGDFEVSGVLGDDPKYTPGATSIRIPLIAYDEDKDKDYEAGAVVIAWTPSAITVTAEVGAPEEYYIVSSYYLYTEEPFEDVTLWYFELDDRYLERNVYYRGTATSKVRTVGTGDSETEVDINTVKLTGEIDSVAPKVAVVSPANASVTGFETVTVSGTASDNGSVESVSVQVNGGDWTAATLIGGNWSLGGVPLKLGLNAIRARALDIDGNQTETASTVERWTPLIVNVSGSGSVTNGFKGTTLRKPGSSVSLKASPSPGHIFAGWSGSVESAANPFSFVVEPGMTVVANFVPLPFTELAGRYSGVLTGTDGSAAGTARVQLNAAGRFTAKFTLDGRKVKLKGNMDATGHFTGLLQKKGKPTLTFDLSLDAENGNQSIIGTISDGIEVISLSSDKAIYSDSNPAPQTGTYTAMLAVPEDADASVPQAPGWATVKVLPHGVVKLVGKFGDGTAFSVNSTVLSNGRVPFYFVSKADRTAVAGTLVIERQEGDVDDVTGQLQWVKGAKGGTLYPAGFQTEVQVRGVSYSPLGRRVLDLTDTAANAEIVVGEGGLPVDQETVITIAPGNDVLVPPSAGLKLVFKPAKGTFKGTFTSASVGGEQSFTGVVLQKHLNTGVGVFPGPQSAGFVQISPAGAE